MARGLKWPEWTGARETSWRRLRKEPMSTDIRRSSVHGLAIVRRGRELRQAIMRDGQCATAGLQRAF
jgi:hypothetical protein